MNIALAATIAALFSCGTYLMLQRQLTRIVVGLAFLAHGANLVIVFSRGGAATPTFIGSADQEAMLDPLPQAFVLTAIVIAFGTTALLLALAYRSWVITHDDEVEDDVEDRLVQLRQVAKEVDALAAAETEDFETLDDGTGRRSERVTASATQEAAGDDEARQGSGSTDADLHGTTGTSR